MLIDRRFVTEAGKLTAEEVKIGAEKVRLLKMKQAMYNRRTIALNQGPTTRAAQPTTTSG